MHRSIERDRSLQIPSEALSKPEVLLDLWRLSQVHRVDPNLDITYETTEQRANLNSSGWKTISYRSETVTHHLTDEEKQRLKARAQFELWQGLREEAGTEGEELANSLLKRTRQTVPEGVVETILYQKGVRLP